jgi:endonuclease/exonuclease/phosphatase family metal-dependent hydrolase
MKGRRVLCRAMTALLLAVSISGAATCGGDSSGGSASTAPATSTAAVPRQFKIVTYNILGGRGGLDQLAKFLREQDADVICLQEVVRDRPSTSGPTSGKPQPPSDQAVRLAELLGGLHVVSATTLRLPAEQDCNVAILSRYPVRESAAYSLDKGGYVYAVRATVTEEKSAEGHAPASPPSSRPDRLRSGQLHLLSVHLHSTHSLETKHIMESTRIRMAQVTQLLDTVRQLQGDLIVAGDFNAAPWMPEYMALTKMLTDLGPKGANEAPTFPSSNPSIRIDYVYARGQFIARTYGPVSVLFSDHLPVIAEIDRRRQADSDHKDR